jgi:hypothetical protein
MTRMKSQRAGTGVLVLALVALIVGSAVAGLSSYYFDTATGSSTHNNQAVQESQPLLRAPEADQPINPTATAAPIPGAPGLIMVNLTGFTPSGKITGSPSGTLTASVLGKATDVVSVLQLPMKYRDATTGKSAAVYYTFGTAAGAQRLLP